uniref:Uncharacterized protein LOC117346379 isoform X2 n=1 Tax=Geotrypetes seraphini TaxID=260995 RepID=A0A6P8N850_GEOSA|nr:uncharacterized protein LOC117346379 isoform X2 [Geotrypetes seraphini]
MPPGYVTSHRAWGLPVAPGLMGDVVLVALRPRPESSTAPSRKELKLPRVCARRWSFLNGAFPFAASRMEPPSGLPTLRKRLSRAREGEEVLQRLNTAEALSKVPALPLDLLSSRKSDYDMPAGTLQLYPFYTQSSYQGMSAEETAMISSQLDTQTQKMEFLTQAVRRLERECQQQQQRIHNLEEEVHCLRSVPRTFSDPTLESRMSELRREVFSELRSLREEALLSRDRGTSLEQASSMYLQQELTDSKRKLWQECKDLRQEIFQLKQDLRRQEESLHHQISDSHSVKKLQDRTCQMLEDVASSHKSQSVDWQRMKLEGEEREQELQALRAAVMSLKEEMKNLSQDNRLSPCIPWHRTSKGHDTQRKQSSEVLSASEESASYLSLADISSEEDMIESTAIPSQSLSSTMPPVTSTAARDSVDDLSSDLEGLSDSLPELSYSDL